MNFNLNLQNAQKLGNYMQPGQYSVKVKTSKVKILKTDILNLLSHSLTEKKETSLIMLMPIWKMSLLEIGCTHS